MARRPTLYLPVMIVAALMVASAVAEHASNSPLWRKPHRYRGMTLMTAMMMMKCKGSLNEVGHSPEMGDGRDHG